MKKNVFKFYYVVAFDLIKSQTHYTPQNDRQNFSFVKDIYVVAKKMTTDGQKRPIFKHLSLIFFFQN